VTERKSLGKAAIGGRRVDSEELPGDLKEEDRVVDGENETKAGRGRIDPTIRIEGNVGTRRRNNANLGASGRRKYVKARAWHN